MQAMMVYMLMAVVDRDAETPRRGAKLVNMAGVGGLPFPLSLSFGADKMYLGDFLAFPPARQGGVLLHDGEGEAQRELGGLDICRDETTVSAASPKMGVSASSRPISNGISQHDLSLVHPEPSHRDRRRNSLQGLPGARRTGPPVLQDAVGGSDTGGVGGGEERVR